MISGCLWCIFVLPFYAAFYSLLFLLKSLEILFKALAIIAQSISDIVDKSKRNKEKYEPIEEKEEIETIKYDTSKAYNYYKYENSNSSYNDEYNIYTEPVIEKPKANKDRLLEPSQYEYMSTSKKIENLYNDFGYEVKVVDIKKNRYNTSYEIIFSMDVNRDDVAGVWDDISHEFYVDGTSIKPIKNKQNRLMVYVPLEFK